MRVTSMDANTKHAGHGNVIHASVERGFGPVVRVTVQDGAVTVGDTFFAGSVAGRVRGIMNDHGSLVKFAIQGERVAVLGLTKLPNPNEEFYTIANWPRTSN